MNRIDQLWEPPPRFDVNRARREAEALWEQAERDPVLQPLGADDRAAVCTCVAFLIEYSLIPPPEGATA